MTLQEKRYLCYLAAYLPTIQFNVAFHTTIKPFRIRTKYSLKQALVSSFMTNPSPPICFQEFPSKFDFYSLSPFITSSVLPEKCAFPALFSMKTKEKNNFLQFYSPFCFSTHNCQVQCLPSVAHVNKPISGGSLHRSISD